MPDTRLMDELQDQLQGMRKLLVSDEWALWANFLKRERRQFLQNRVNSAVESGNIDEAQIALALMKDCIRQIELFGNYVKETESRINNKGAV